METEIINQFWYPQCTFKIDFMVWKQLDTSVSYVTISTLNRLYGIETGVL